MFSDAKWLVDLFKLPTKPKVAILLAAAALYFLFKTPAISFGELDPIIANGLLVLLVVSGALVVVDGFTWLGSPLANRRHGTLLAARRAARRQEALQQRNEQQATTLARLDHLSGWELDLVADALNGNSPTFYTWAHSPPAGTLLGKGLTWTTNGQHPQDHYPFTFHDFVWDELVRRRDEFLAKEKAFKDAEEARKRRR